MKESLVHSVSQYFPCFCQDREASPTLLTLPGLTSSSNSPALPDTQMQLLPTSPANAGLPGDTAPVMGSISGQKKSWIKFSLSRPTLKAYHTTHAIVFSCLDWTVWTIAISCNPVSLICLLLYKLFPTPRPEGYLQRVNRTIHDSPTQKHVLKKPRWYSSQLNKVQTAYTVPEAQHHLAPEYLLPLSTCCPLCSMTLSFRPFFQHLVLIPTSGFHPPVSCPAMLLSEIDHPRLRCLAMLPKVQRRLKWKTKYYRY